jgi:hypothetical protein
MVTPSKKSTSQMQEEIVTLLVNSLIAAGYLLTVDNGGEEDEITDSNSAIDTMAVMRATADETIYARKPGEEGSYFVSLIYGYGNQAWEMISDYSVALEDVLKPANDLGNAFAEAEEG